jgi:hypothetical protein
MRAACSTGYPYTPVLIDGWIALNFTAALYFDSLCMTPHLHRQKLGKVGFPP